MENIFKIFGYFVFLNSKSCKKKKWVKKNKARGDFPVVQWLRLHAPKIGGLSSILGQGTRSHMLQLKGPHAATKIEDLVCHS